MKKKIYVVFIIRRNEPTIIKTDDIVDAFQIAGQIKNDCDVVKVFENEKELWKHQRT